VIRACSSRAGPARASAAQSSSPPPPRDPLPIGVRAARSLLSGLGNALAVVRAGDASLAQALREAGCEVLESPDSADKLSIMKQPRS